MDGSIDADMLKASWGKAFNADVAHDMFQVEEPVSMTGCVTENASAEEAISVTADVARRSRVAVDVPARDPAATMEVVPITASDTETGPDAEMITVSDAATEIPAKRKCASPAKGGVAMTDAERSGQYRERNRPHWRNRRVELWPSTVRIDEDLAVELGVTLDDAIYQAICFMVHHSTELSDLREACERRISKVVEADAADA